MLEKTNRMNALYDFYHVLLTPNKKHTCPFTIWKISR